MEENCALEKGEKNNAKGENRYTVEISQMNFLGHGNIIMQIEFKCTHSRILCAVIHTESLNLHAKDLFALFTSVIFHFLHSYSEYMFSFHFCLIAC